ESDKPLDAEYSFGFFEDSDEGLAAAMRLGVADPDALPGEFMAGVTARFRTADDRLADPPRRR
ncbi:MAG TPA: hypothetical protein VGR12_01290, partial [Solirubrobacteraceae bacterium]|nr:hypothetical protein [Solirubrobacteraceae bacterium]